MKTFSAWFLCSLKMLYICNNTISKRVCLCVQMMILNCLNYARSYYKFVIISNILMNFEKWLMYIGHHSLSSVVILAWLFAKKVIFLQYGKNSWTIWTVLLCWKSTRLIRCWISGQWSHCSFMHHMVTHKPLNHLLLRVPICVSLPLSHISRDI